MEIHRQFGWMDVVGHRKHFHLECVAIANQGALYSALTERSVQNLSCVYQVPWRSIVSLDGWMDGGRRSSKTFHLECVAIADQGALYSSLTERSVKSIEDQKFNV